MALVFVDNVVQYTATIGTGTVTLGAAVPGSGTLANRSVANGSTLYYSIRDGAAQETGLGTYTSSGTTFSRDTVYTSTAGGTTKISLSGSAIIWFDVASQFFTKVDVTILSTGDGAGHYDIVGNSLLIPDGNFTTTGDGAHFDCYNHTVRFFGYKFSNSTYLPCIVNDVITVGLGSGSNVSFDGTISINTSTVIGQLTIKSVDTLIRPTVAMRATNTAFGFDIDQEMVSIGRLDVYAVVSGVRTLAMSILRGNGHFGFGTNNPGAQIEIDADAAATKGLILKGAASRSAPLLQLQSDAGASLGNVGGVIFNNFTDTSTTHTDGTEDDLYSYTTAANTLAINGDSIEEIEHIQTIASATATRRIKKYFGGTLIFDSGGITVAGGDDITVRTTIIRESSTVVRCTVIASATTITTIPPTTYTRITGLTLSGTNILKTTGIASGTGAASGDIVNKLAKVWAWPAS